MKGFIEALVNNVSSYRMGQRHSQKFLSGRALEKMVGQRMQSQTVDFDCYRRLQPPGRSTLRIGISNVILIAVARQKKKRIM